MQRITVSFDEPLAAALDGYLEATGYRSRSEGVRDIVRDTMGRANNERASHRHSVANLSYIYDRRVRRLASRLSELQHAHHDLVAATTSLPLDHSSSRMRDAEGADDRAARLRGRRSRRTGRALGRAQPRRGRAG
jgi:CopG family nickel-responsive transcriptional regulator